MNQSLGTDLVPATYTKISSIAVDTRLFCLELENGHAIARRAAVGCVWIRSGGWGRMVILGRDVFGPVGDCGEMGEFVSVLRFSGLES